MKNIVDKYYIEDVQVEPSLAITLNDNWIQFNLRYIVDYKKRRLTKNILNQEIAITVEIVRIQTLDMNEKTSHDRA